MAKPLRVTSARGLMVLACTALLSSCSNSNGSGADTSTNPTSSTSAAGFTAATETAGPTSSGDTTGNEVSMSAASSDSTSGMPESAGGTGGAPATSSTGESSTSPGTGNGGGSTSATTGSTGGGPTETFPSFTRHTIASFASGYTTVVTDIDGDGLLDVVALSSGAAGLVWFKNPEWTQYTITTAAKQLIYTAPYDVDGDGHIDLAIAHDFDMNNTNSGGTISWAQAPDDPTQNQEWVIHPIDSIPTSHRLRWADLDGDGKKELVVLPIFGVGSSAPAHEGPVTLEAYFIPPDAMGNWAAEVLDQEHLEVAHDLRVVDWDGDQAEDLLTAANDGVYLFRPSLGGSAEHIAAGAPGEAPNRGSSEVGLGSLGGQRFIATIDPWHGTDAVVYTPGATDSELWTRQVLGSDFEHGHGFAVADLDSDGFDEIIAGGGQGELRQLIYRYAPSSRAWNKIELDVGNVAVSGMDVQDINGDGALDIVTIGGPPTNNVVWYENSR